MNNNLSNRKEYVWADYFRLICAVGVVALHLDPFYDINEHVNFFVGSVLTRLCVPFFFLLSGFFLKDKLSEGKSLKKYIWNLIKLYIVYTVLSLPMICREYKENGEMILKDGIDFLRRFFLIGSYGQLWYFLALIFAVVFLYVMVTKISLGEKPMLVITVILYLIGLFFRVYDKPIRDTVDAIRFVEMYDSVFKTTRNGLFFGTPFVYWGNLIWKKNIDVDRKKCAICFWVAFLVLTMEAVFVRNIIGARQLDMLIFLPAATVFMVLLILSKEKDGADFGKALWCRKMSVIIFGFHMLFFFCVDKIQDYLELKINSMVCFLIVIFLCYGLGAAMIFLSKKKYGKWIEKIFV